MCLSTHQAPLLLSCICLHAVPAASTLYTSSSGASFYLNTTAVDFEGALSACNINGGHLAIYTRADEQVEVSASKAALFRSLLRAPCC